MRQMINNVMTYIKGHIVIVKMKAICFQCCFFNAPCYFSKFQNNYLINSFCQAHIKKVT